MNIQKPSANPCDWKKSSLWLALAVACFHAAYTSIHFPTAGLLIFGYAYERFTYKDFMVGTSSTQYAGLLLPGTVAPNDSVHIAYAMLRYRF